MSIFSLFSSLSIIPVFRVSFIDCRSAVMPGHIVLTFQLAIRRAGVFFFFFVFLGAGLFGLLVELVL